MECHLFSEFLLLIFFSLERISSLARRKKRESFHRTQWDFLEEKQSEFFAETSVTHRIGSKTLETTGCLRAIHRWIPLPKMDHRLSAPNCPFHTSAETHTQALGKDCRRKSPWHEEVRTVHILLESLSVLQTLDDPNRNIPWPSVDHCYALEGRIK